MEDISDAFPPPRGSALRRYNVERSCLKCHERKIRCDKRTPCASCVRLGTLCRYPGPERAKRRQQQKVVVTDISTRLTQLERAVTALAEGQIPARNDANSPKKFRSINERPENPLHQSTLRDTLPPARRPSSGPTGVTSKGLLLPDRLYINDRLLSRVLEKEQELQSAIGGPKISNTDTNNDSKSSSINVDTILFGSGQCAIDIVTLHPSQREVSQLWQAYITNVNMHIKVLHIPTVQSMLFAAIKDLKNVPYDFNALMFAIYFCATSSLDPVSVGRVLGQERHAALRRFQQGIEQCLSRASFLELPTVTSLQAFVMFLMSARVHNKGRSSWTLTSLAARLAQSIGLHRDGKNFNLPPLESELRRRLWWQIVNNDHRASEDHGISICTSYGFCDTEYPLHINDADISIHSQTLPPPRKEFCDMTSFVIITEASSAFREYLPATRPFRCSVGPSDIDKRKQLGCLLNRLERIYLPICDINIPTQRSAYYIGKVLISKMKFLDEQQSTACETNDKTIASGSTDHSLVLACKVLEVSNILLQDELLSHCHWIFLSYTQYHAVIYILWHMCVNPAVQDADYIWNLVNHYITLVESFQAIADLGPKWPFVRRLREKALSIREKSTIEETVSNESQQQNSHFPLDSEAMPIARAGVIHEDFLDYVDWDFSASSFADWSNFSLNLDKYSYES
ncbi:fungal-specific transcription factor domain-containing protein [Talaromyces proteolyticus]|uniref:Fungal-specific transcription factor domain-containing protein n=1 Tax=Talaromyces proteolyticus TaxID=1131652 RepID=A0AAD4PVT8_9EURO|nr:fungal-specific transcription factor domain-containing protein [Talaromyces proteolyticus]KAH8690685.1 fungal-specific transcription factor domain-containing protein [Talaromyces proteolyticus]